MRKALLVVAPLLLWAQASLPDTPAAQFPKWLRVFNDGDRSQIQQYFEENFPERPQMVDQTMAMRKHVGGYDLEKVEKTTDAEIW